MDTVFYLLGLLGCSFVAGLGLTSGALAIFWLFGLTDEPKLTDEPIVEDANGGGW